MYAAHRLIETGRQTVFEPSAEEQQLNKDMHAAHLGLAAVGASLFGAGLGISLESDASGVAAALMAVGAVLGTASTWAGSQLRVPRQPGDQHDA